MAEKEIRAQTEASDSIIAAEAQTSPGDAEVQGPEEPAPVRSPFAPVTLTEPAPDVPEDRSFEPELPRVEDPLPSAAGGAAKGSGGGRFVGLLAGGVVAAGLGFGLATWGVQQGWPFLAPATEPTASASDLTALQAEVARLSAALASAEAAPAVDTAALESRLSALEARPVAGDSADLAPVLQRLSAVETGLAGLPSGDSDSIRAEIETQVAERMKSVEAEAQGLKDEAEAVRSAAADRAALLTVQGAFSSGQGLPEAVAAAKERGIAIPEALETFAAVPVSLTTLQAGFPEAARAALAASRAAEQGQGPATSRLTTFLMQQTGARLIEPREGTDPDAVLSRMEAALEDGDVAAARAMVADLPPAAAEALADWSGQADTWMAARAAIATLIPAE